MAYYTSLTFEISYTVYNIQSFIETLQFSFNIYLYISEHIFECMSVYSPSSGQYDPLALTMAPLHRNTSKTVHILLSAFSCSQSVRRCLMYHFTNVGFYTPTAPMCFIVAVMGYI